MPSDDPQNALEDMLAYIARIEQFVSALDEAKFYRDDKTMFAAQYALL